MALAEAWAAHGEDRRDSGQRRGAVAGAQQGAGIAEIAGKEARLAGGVAAEPGAQRVIGQPRLAPSSLREKRARDAAARLGDRPGGLDIAGGDRHGERGAGQLLGLLVTPLLMDDGGEGERRAR